MQLKKCCHAFEYLLVDDSVSTYSVFVECVPYSKYRGSHTCWLVYWMNMDNSDVTLQRIISTAGKNILLFTCYLQFILLFTIVCIASKICYTVFLVTKLWLIGKRILKMESKTSCCPWFVGWGEPFNIIRRWITLNYGSYMPNATFTLAEVFNFKIWNSSYRLGVVHT